MPAAAPECMTDARFGTQPASALQSGAAAGLLVASALVARWRGVVAQVGSEPEQLAPDVDKTIARMNSTAHNDGGFAPSGADKRATKGNK